MTTYPSGYETSIVVTELCEVTVIGCRKDGFYGQNCDLMCPLHCQDRRCHIINGTCLGCAAGWIGNFCEKICMFGFYGMECKSSCTGHCLGGVSCNHITGKCEQGCEEGWMMPNCDQPCQDGMYGPNCMYKCSSHCTNGLPCDKESGKCESCASGYIGTFCNNSCSKGTYGQNCSENCHMKCQGQNCFHENGFCSDGCEDGYQGNTCTEECSEGLYGYKCSRHCSFNCKREKCHNVHGECSYGCKPGWTGSNCTQSCDEGFYGNNCLKSCSNCLNNTCYPFNGICIQGCTDGYIGRRCEQPCFQGWYGKNCSNSCHINCRNKSCDNIHGVCTYGCEAGWMGLNCSEECNDGRYGEDCEQICGKGAFNNTCNRTNGTCLIGCAEPFTGVKCDKNTKRSLKLEAATSSESDSYYGYVIALSVVLAVSIVIHVSTVLVILRRRYIRSELEASRQYAKCGDVSATKTENTHTYQDLNVINNNLSEGKNSAQSSTWTCTQTNCHMYKANNAVDGDINTCMRTKMIGPAVAIKRVWWRVDLGDIQSIYSIRIRFKRYEQQFYNRQRGRLAGFTLYVSNTTNINDSYLCYKDGPGLPLLDFVNVCTVHGRYVTFYNERKNMSYPAGYETTSITELCEVNVIGCQNDGYYGQNCDLTCPLHCQNRRCHIIIGTCFGCTAGWKGEFCNKTCMFGYYGMECKSRCTGHCLGGASCNHTSGQCEHGCEKGWMMPNCDQPCQDGMYGSNCAYKCSDHCKNSLPCDKASGICESCAPGYIGIFCNNSCSKGTYGQNCSENCYIKCRGQNCFYENGFCTEGCDDGYQGNTCTENCNKGWYGENCSRRCSFNCQRDLCHNVHGDCRYGCTPGWRGSHCSQACKMGSYGENCSKNCSAFCRVKPHCNNTNGHCLNGCMDGYIEPKCDESCIGGWYGKNCSEPCNENCVNQDCDHRDGMCVFGCKPGWTSANCSKACEKGYYGKNCSNTCFNCLKNDCEPLNGTCTQGCDDGYIGQKCEKSCDEGWYGKKCSNFCNQNCAYQLCNNADGGCKHGCEAGWMGFNCSHECMLGMYGEDCRNICGSCAENETCNRFNGTCRNGCTKAFTGEKCNDRVMTLKNTALEREAADNGVLGGSLATCFLLIGAVVIITIFIIRRKRNTMRKNTANRQQGHEEIEINGFDNVVFKPQPVPDKISPKHKTITILELEERMKSMSDNENVSFKKEYEKIPKGELYPCTEGKKPENVSKNRYTTTFPYDHSRVILKKLNPKESDYINANYIENVQGRKAYIATQGPKPKTIADFWRMVWQENVSIIVCLTNLKEGMKTKCALYWPNVNDKIQNGQLYVRQQDEKVYANHTIRKLRIRNTVENTERDVIMFHYTQWPDHGVPDPLNLVVFHRHVMRMSAIYYAEYSLVHCSAGVGRTGTYIALDALCRQADETGKINVPKYLETMRKDRMNMIQGEDQYKTVYLALYESFRGKARCISTDRFLEQFQEQSCYTNLGHVANKSPLSVEFEELFSLRKEYSETDYEFGRKNMDANLSPNILPVDAYICHVVDSKGAERYYNAIVLQSFTRSDCLISAQFPLPDYVEDFLSLVRAFYTPIIVSLFPLREFPSSSFWVPRKNENKTVGEHTTKFSDCTKMPNITKTNIVLHSKTGSAVRVTILESTTWKGENDTSGRRILIDLIKEAKMEGTTYPGARILVLSSDGAKRCGQFCVVYNALEQMSMDGEVDIFTITRQLQIRRPEFINSLEDYQFCYDAVADYLQNDTVYANC